MIFPRTKLIESFREKLIESEHQYIALTGPSGSGKTTFAELIEQSDVLDPLTTEYIFIDADAVLAEYAFELESPKTIVIDSAPTLRFSEIRTFIESKMIDSKIIFTSEELVFDTQVDLFLIPWISYREYAEGFGTIIDINSIMAGDFDIQAANVLRDEYIGLGQFGVNLVHPEHITQSFDEKISNMVQELFEKEKEDFMEYVRTIAMNVGNLFKEDQIAKMTGLSRRKIHKYTDLALKHDFLRAIGPFMENPATELSRHVKLYFSDLSYYHEALGVAYYHGSTKQWVIENFLFIELSRKLDATHELRFYRKKSGAEIPFLLINKETNLLTPIDVSMRSTEAISQALKTFAESYNERVEYYMISNETLATRLTLRDKSVFVFPHIAL